MNLVTERIFELDLNIKFSTRASASVHIYYLDQIKIDYDNLPPQLIKDGTIRDLLYGKHNLPLRRLPSRRHRLPRPIRVRRHEMGRYL
ncbi:uncharacterized protein BDV14DRAFT_106526 [Aspergillus stella-maris]|uniref:uncharacterized protein n=1 Tax=Aspergillus stella-maris TaxID=1810926 RepID=UPI003CCDF014